MACNNCGRQTPRSHLCKQCGRDARWEETARAQLEDDEADDTLLVYECTSCGEHYEATDISVDCPACGAGRCRCLGDATEVAC